MSLRAKRVGPARGRILLLAATAALAVPCLWASSAQALKTHNFIASISSAELLNPYGAAVDDSGSASAGDLYVVIPPAAPPKVIKFDADGNEISKIDNSNLAGCPGATDFNNPFGVAVDPSNGELYVTDNGANTVTAFDPAGACLFQIHEGLSGPLGVAVDPTHGANGTLYVAANGTQTIESLDASTGALISSFSSSPGTVFSLAVDTAGDIFIARYNESVLEYDPSGNCLGGCVPIDANAPVSIAVDRSDNHLFVAGNSQITEYAPGEATPLTAFGQGHVGGLPFGLSVNSTSGRVYASDFYSSAAEIFGPLVTLPDVTTGAPTNPGQTSATLSGHVDPDSAHGGGTINECHFEYGTDTSYGSGTIPCEPSAPLAGPTDVTANLGGLTSETTYHYRLYAKNVEGASVGQDEIFTPHAVAGLETQAATNIGPDSAQLNGSFVGNGEDTHFYFEWGTDTSYGHETVLEDAGAPTGPTPTPVSFNLSGLTTLVGYHFRIVAENSAGTSFGQDQEFSTLQAVAGITTEPPTEVKSTVAMLNGSFVGNGEDTHYYFEWGTDPSYGHATPEVDAHSPSGPSPTQVSSEVTGLDPFTAYHYRVVASNGGGMNYGGDQEFMTLPGPPSISAESVSDIRSRSAVLHGQVNPENGDTTYYFEYGLEDCAVSSCVATASVDIGAAPSPVGVGVPAVNLTSATTYHWRIVAESVGGTTAGPDRTFSTYSFVPSLTDTCPNAEARQQTGAALLLDCRAYELVSAGNSGGYDVMSQSPYGGFPEAENPSRVLYAVSGGGIPGVGRPTNRGPDPYIATRGEGGWSTAYVGVPADNPFSAAPFSSIVSGADASLDTFAFGGAEGCSPCFEGGYTGIPVRNEDGELVQGMSGPLNPGPSAEPDGYIAKDLSANGEHFIFGSTSLFAPGGYSDTGDVSIYDHNLVTGKTVVISNTPVTEDFPVPLPCLQGAGSCHSPGDGNGIAELAISSDGSHILLGQRVATDAEGNNEWHLYMNVGDSIRTIDLTPGATHGVLFGGMSSDGSKVFFTSRDQLAGGGDTDSSSDIYEAEISGSAATVTPVSTGIEGAGNTDSCNPVSNSNGERWNAVGAASTCDAVAIGGGGGVGTTDASVYFLSPEKLDGTANGTANQPNLYLAPPGSAPSFIATLAPDDPVVLDAVRTAATRKTADFQVTASGDFAAFTTSRPLESAYENAGHSEIYRYDATPGTLSCLSCNPTGVEPVGDASLASQGLSLTEDGRVFWTTPDALVLRDVDNREDVYEWEAEGIDTCNPANPNFFKTAGGCLGLVSAGSSPFDSSLLGASSDSRDVYFFTRDSLAAQDHNGPAMKIYDARAGGGFFEVPEPPLCAASDECHGAGSQAPGPPEIRTTASSPGSVVATKCKKGFVKKHGKCVEKRHKAKHHHGKGHQHG